jgi:hypothetical protein
MGPRMKVHAFNNRSFPEGKVARNTRTVRKAL